jgi:hypothetical protein
MPRSDSSLGNRSTPVIKVYNKIWNAVAQNGSTWSRRCGCNDHGDFIRMQQRTLFSGFALNFRKSVSLSSLGMIWSRPTRV